MYALPDEAARIAVIALESSDYCKIGLGNHAQQPIGWLYETHQTTCPGRSVLRSVRTRHVGPRKLPRDGHRNRAAKQRRYASVGIDMHQRIAMLRRTQVLTSG